MTEPREFAGRSVLLTGALGTLGQAQAEAFAHAGASLVLLDLPGHVRGEELAFDLARRHKVAVRYLGQDLGDLAESASAVRKLGPIDVLVNNAALIVNKPLLSIALDDYEAQVRINSSAAFALAQAVAPLMMERRSGVIVNFTSITLNGRWEGFAPYVASKGAMLGLTKSLARDLGSYGIRVNAVSPGAVTSEAEERVFGDKLQEYNDWILANQSLKQRIQPAQVADLVLFLCEDRSAMITGQNIAIDGGW